MEYEPNPLHGGVWVPGDDLRIYPAGPISSAEVALVFTNIDMGLEWSARIAEADRLSPYPVFSDFQIWMRVRNVTIDRIYRASLAWLHASHAIFLIPGWDESVGAKREHADARKFGIPVFDDFVALLAWRDDVLTGAG